MDAKYVSKKLNKIANRLDEIVSMFRELDDLQTERTPREGRMEKLIEHLETALELARHARPAVAFTVTPAELDELFRCAGIMRELGNGKTSSHAAANTSLAATAEHAAKVQGVVDSIRARAR